MPVFRPNVNYSLRPAKAAVRHIIVDALSRLGPLEPLENYEYVGMGSIFFRDFQLIHRKLGVKKMTTIEGDPRAVDRVKFNLPFDCIQPIMLTTGAALPRIPLEDNPYILWLDYESRVDPFVLSDIEEALGRCSPRSVFIVTANANPLKKDDCELWLDELGSGRLEPSRPTSKSDYALLSYRWLRSAIDQTMRMRNAALPATRQVEFRQVFHIVYSDNAQMVTVGGVLINAQDRWQWDACRIEPLDIARLSETALWIRIPILTRREVHHLLRQLPGNADNLQSAAAMAGIPARDAREFAAIYRHAPLFVEADEW